MKSKPVVLSTPAAPARPVKRVALVLCRTIRNVSHGAAQVPSIINQAASDVRDAWRESAFPNA